MSPAAMALMNRIQVSLNDPPPGVEYVRRSANQNGLIVQVRVNEEEVEPGTNGNLIFDAVLKPAPGSTGRNPLGSFPAVPFEILEP